MKFTRILAVAVTGTLLTGAFCFSQFSHIQASAPASKADDEALYKHGEYIVHKLAMCIDCHSPRGEGGVFLEGRHLMGAPIGFTPSMPMPFWATLAPPIAGLPSGWTHDHMVEYLMSGTRPHNLPPSMPPMPPYRMNADDAKAVAHYLHKLGQPK